ncbi:MAG: TlpA family protein disulfide reductase [Acidimicrobiales bacterium]
MPQIAYAAALALAAVFAAAAIAKLRRRPTTERAFGALGLASPRALALGVPTAELTLAAGLVVVPAEAGTAALAVLAGFTTFLARSIRRGDALGCGCFGTAQPAPAGITEVVRNGFLAAAAVLAAFARGPVVPGLGAVAVVVAGAAVAVAVLAVVSRREGRWPSPAPAGPLPGSLAPPLSGLVHEGPAATATLIAFVAPTCEGCAELRSCLAAFAGRGLRQRVVELDDGSAAAFVAFGVRSTPYLVVVDGQGRVRSSGPARTHDDVERLLAAWHA